MAIDLARDIANDFLIVSIMVSHLPGVSMRKQCVHTADIVLQY